MGEGDTMWKMRRQSIRLDGEEESREGDASSSVTTISSFALSMVPAVVLRRNERCHVASSSTCHVQRQLHVLFRVCHSTIIGQPRPCLADYSPSLISNASIRHYRYPETVPKMAARMIHSSALHEYLHVRPWIRSPPLSISPPAIPNARRSRRVASHLLRDRFPFLRLPRELRNLVYDFVFSDYAFEFCHINMRFRASYRPLANEDTSKPSTKKSMKFIKPTRWPPRCILVSKQFFSEALAQFHHMAWFTP